VISRRQILALARRFPFGATCCAITGVFLAIASILWFQNRQLAVRHRNKQIEGEAVLSTLISAPQLRLELAFTHETIRRITENLSSEEDLQDDVRYFRLIEEQSQARLEDLHSLSAPAPDMGSEYKQVPFNLRVSGNFEQITAFIFGIETGPRLARITYFSFRRRAPGSSLIVLELNLNLLGKS
jgi:Tfp pilus assembly protein PilO